MNQTDMSKWRSRVVLSVIVLYRICCNPQYWQMDSGMEEDLCPPIEQSSSNLVEGCHEDMLCFLSVFFQSF
jgi:hypothetical protein